MSEQTKIPTNCTASTFDEALQIFEKLANENHQYKISYRGHADSEWILKPSLFRQNPDISQFEHQMIREMISAFPGQFSQDLSMFDKLVRMQHFGLPTRLLDMSRNPLVALYFACDPSYDDNIDGAVIFMLIDHSRHKFFDSDVVSCMSNLANLTQDERKSIEDTPLGTINELLTLNSIKRLIQFIKVEKPYFESRIKKVDLFRPVAVTPKMSNLRLNAQFGEFVIYGLENSKGPSYSRTNRITKVIISAEAKSAIRGRLENLGISGATLFPEMDKAAAQIRNKYLNF